MSQPSREAVYGADP